MENVVLFLLLDFDIVHVGSVKDPNVSSPKEAEKRVILASLGFQQD